MGETAFQAEETVSAKVLGVEQVKDAEHVGKRPKK